MSLYQSVTQYGNSIIEKSQDYTDNKTVNYAYAMGYFISSMGCLLDELNLTKEQLKIVNKRFNNEN